MCSLKSICQSFLAWEKLVVDSLRARKAAWLSQKAAVQICSEWQYCLVPGCSGLFWEPVLGPQAAGTWHKGVAACPSQSHAPQAALS